MATNIQALETMPYTVQGVSTIVERPGELNDDQRALVISMFGKDVPDHDITMFFAQVKAFGLNPLAAGQIWGVPRKSGNATRLVTQIGVNGLVLIAERSGKYDGMGAPEWCRIRRLRGDDGSLTDEPDPDAPETWRTLWNYDEPPDAARVAVYRKGTPHPTVGVANWREYAQYAADGWVPMKGRDGKPVLKPDGTPRMVPNGKKLTEMWARMPAGQLAKCAAATALRRAFQQEFAGLRAAIGIVEPPRGRATVSDLYSEEIGTLDPEADKDAGRRYFEGVDVAPDVVDSTATEVQDRSADDKAAMAAFWKLEREMKTAKTWTDAETLGHFAPAPREWAAAHGGWAEALAVLRDLKDMAGSSSAPAPEAARQEPTAACPGCGDPAAWRGDHCLSCGFNAGDAPPPGELPGMPPSQAAASRRGAHG